MAKPPKFGLHIAPICGEREYATRWRELASRVYWASRVSLKNLTVVSGHLSNLRLNPEFPSSDGSMFNRD
jgi:hypothetical protein